MKVSYHVMERDHGGYVAAVMRDGKVWGQRGPYATIAEARRAIDLMAGDTGDRIGDSGEGARTLARAAQ